MSLPQNSIVGTRHVQSPNFLIPIFLEKSMKKLDFILTISILLTLLIAPKSVLGNIANPITQNPPIDEPFCYLKTPDGRIVDLGKLCEKQPDLGTSQTCIPGVNIAAKVSIVAINYDGNFLSGKAINQGCKIIKNVKVNYEVLDESGNLIDNGFINTQPVTLAPGESAAFRGAVVAGAQVRATHAEGQE